MFLRHDEHVWIVVAERRREDDFGPVQFDHAFHGFLDVGRVGDSFLLEHFDSGHFLDFRGSDGVGLVVAVVVARTDVDEADCEGIAAAVLADRGVATTAAHKRKCQEAERERPDAVPATGLTLRTQVVQLSGHLFVLALTRGATRIPSSTRNWCLWRGTPRLAAERNPSAEVCNVARLFGSA